MNDGGPAFPNDRYGDKGMSLRDYFAAQAMQALVSISDQGMRQRGLDSTLAFTKQSAIVAYAFADAMLAERAKP